MSKFKYTNFIPLDTPIETTESPRWEFEYGDKDDIQGFDCHLKCMQCMAKTGKRRCRRKTCYTAPLCWQHLKNLAHLRIGRTTLVDPSTGERFKFLGLFACNSKKPGEVVFRKRDPIVPYIGEKKTFDDIERVYNREGNEDATVPYGEVTEVPGGDDIVIDGACFRGVASLANDAIPGSVCEGGRQGQCRTNSYFFSGDGNYPILVASRNIRDGDEIFVSYGEEYWEGEHKPHRTKPQRAYEKLNYKC
jgi:hypothetical protein